MKTLIVVVALVIGFTSCSKDQTVAETQSKPVFVRVEAVDVEGQAIYSDISVVR